MSDRELFDKVVSCAEPGSAHAGWVAARAQLLLQQLSSSGLSTRQQCLQYLGEHFRIVLNLPDRWVRCVLFSGEQQSNTI
jgi:DNA-directed RNA polymerase I subunit RPA2